MINCPNCQAILQNSVNLHPEDTNKGAFYLAVLSSDHSYFQASFVCTCGAAGELYWDFNPKVTEWEMEEAE